MEDAVQHRHPRDMYTSMVQRDSVDTPRYLKQVRSNTSFDTKLVLFLWQIDVKVYLTN